MVTLALKYDEVEEEAMSAGVARVSVRESSAWTEVLARAQLYTPDYVKDRIKADLLARLHARGVQDYVMNAMDELTLPSVPLSEDSVEFDGDQNKNPIKALLEIIAEQPTINMDDGTPDESAHIPMPPRPKKDADTDADAE